MSDLTPAVASLIEALARQAAQDYLTDPAGHEAAAEAGVEYVKPTAPPRRACVYRYFDDAGNLLYIGSSVSPHNRKYGHRSASSWYSRSVRMTEEWFGSQREAMDAELRAIKNEAPLHNKQGVPKSPRFVQHETNNESKK